MEVFEFVIDYILLQSLVLVHRMEKMRFISTLIIKTTSGGDNEHLNRDGVCLITANISPCNRYFILLQLNIPKSPKAWRLSL